MRFLTITTALCSVVILSACSSTPKLINEYKIDVQQGNVLTQEMVSQLRPGLTREQVRYVLGSPVLTDIFHANRWDYVYRLKRGDAEQAIARRFSVFFDAEGKLYRVDGDLDVAQENQPSVPGSRVQVIDLGSMSDTPVTTGAMPVVPTEKGWWGRMLNKVGL